MFWKTKGIIIWNEKEKSGISDEIKQEKFWKQMVLENLRFGFEIEKSAGLMNLALYSTLWMFMGFTPSNRGVSLLLMICSFIHCSAVFDASMNQTGLFGDELLPANPIRRLAAQDAGRDFYIID